MAVVIRDLRSRQVDDLRNAPLDALVELLQATKLMEPKPCIPEDTSAIVLEASRVATAKMLDYYKRMGIRVTPEMTLAPEKPKRTARKRATSGA